MSKSSAYSEHDGGAKGYGSTSDEDDPLPSSTGDSYFSSPDISSSTSGTSYDTDISNRPVEYKPPEFFDEDDGDGDPVIYSMYIPGKTREERLMDGGDDAAPSPSIVAKQAAEASMTQGPSSSNVERSKTGLPIDWNEEFQQLLEMPESTQLQRLEKNHRISALSKNFVDLAKRWGKVIIEEHFLLPQFRTIAPIDIGGQAGGVKYVYNGILFKLQTDWKGIYSSHFLAMKTGGLELKGLMRYYGCEGIHVPMMAVIDYRGFRLVAMSILPIEKKKTLVYGSADAGKTVHASDPYLNKMMAQAAAKINLKGHQCGKDKETMKFLHAPTDIEGHLGLDKRYYVLDFARMYPPTAEEGVRKTFLYKVFRPEFVSRYRTALSSDAFSPFSMSDQDRKQHEAEVAEATQTLLNETIPAFAQWLDDNYKSVRLEENLDSLTEMVHREGINVRYVGMVRSLVKADYLKSFILMEMVARVIKHKVRASLRETMQSQRTLASDAFTNVILDNFNQMLGYHERSMQFWTLIQKRLEYFKAGLTEDEKKSAFDLKAAIDVKCLFKRLQDMLGVKLSYDSKKEFEAHPNEFKVVVADVTDVHVKVKKMNTISLAEGNALAIQAIQELSNEGSRHHDRLFRLAMAKFDSAILATPDNTSMLRHYARILTEVAILKAKAGESALDYLSKAYEKYQIASDLAGLLELGQQIVSSKLLWSEKDKALSLSDKCFLEVLRVDGINFEASTQRGFLFLMKAQRLKNASLLEEAGVMFRKSIALSPGGKFGWLAEWFSSLSNVNLAILVQVMDDHEKVEFDASRCLQPSLISDELVQALVKNVPSLRRLKLSKTSITDAALIAISKTCTDLEAIALKACVEITDTGLGHVVSSCPQIASLDISQCPKLTNFSFTTAFSKLPKLESMNCEFCHFDGRHLSALDWLQTSNLKYLNLSNVNLVPEVWVKAFSSVKFDKLVEVDLTEAVNLNDACVAALVKLSGSNIEKITLDSASRINDESLVAIANSSPKLRHLSFNSCTRLTGKGLEILATLNSNLETLSMDYCAQIFDPDRSGFDKLLERNLRLKKISMNGSTLDDELMTAFSNSRSLEEVSFSGTQVSALGMNIIAKQNSNLGVLNLSSLTSLADEFIPVLARTVGSNLISLNLDGSRKVGSALAHLGTYCEKLSILRVSGSFIDADTLDKITKGCPDLKELNLVDCRDLTDACIPFISRLHSLERLDLGKCILISNIEVLATGCPMLEFLSLERCEHIESSSIVALAILPLLKELNVVGVHGADDNMLVSFRDQSLWRSLSQLHIGSGNKFSNETLEQYLPTRPNLNVNMLMKSGPVPSPLQANKKLKIVLNQSTSLPTLNVPGSPTISTSSSSNRTDVAATRRLMQDLKQLQKFPVPSIAACPIDDSNMFIWHCNLRAPDGSLYQGATFHIELRFPPDYPTSPPRATMFTPCPHPHVKDGRICLDILSDFSSFFSDSSEGWTSAYSVQTILIQIQTFLMDLTPNEKDSTPIGEYLQRIPAAIASANTFKCQTCAHSPGKVWPELPGIEVAKSAERSELEIIQDELKCYHSQLTYKEDVLGIGITIERYKAGDPKELSSPFELLSRTAFFDDKVRTSVYATDENGNKVTFDEWLPLYICKEHYERSVLLLGQSLMRICNAKTFTFDLALQVFPKMMNKMVVSLMKGKLHGSVKALEGYMAFHRLIILYCEKYPDLLKKVNATVGNFIESEGNRNKRAVPDLGEFMALLSVSSYSWEDVSTAYLSENFTRNVRWIIQKYPELNTYTPNNEIDKNRISKSFVASQTSISLMMYNVYFLENIGRPKGRSLKDVAENYDALYGHATNVMKEKFLQCIADVRAVKDYRDVFKRIGVAVPTDSELIAWFRSSVKKSIEQNYHSLDGDSVKVSSSNSNSNFNSSSGSMSSSSSGIPRSTSGGGAVGYGRGKPLASASASLPPSMGGGNSSPSKDICRDWERNGKCSRERCRFAHPPLRKR